MTFNRVQSAWLHIIPLLERNIVLALTANVMMAIYSMECALIVIIINITLRSLLGTRLNDAEVKGNS